MCNNIVIIVYSSKHILSLVCKCLCLLLVFDSVAGCYPGRAENPECIAPEEADGDVPQGGGARADDRQGEEPTTASTIPTRRRAASAEGAYLLAENDHRTPHIILMK